MCNPRRVVVNVSRQMEQAWEREVERCAEVVGSVAGEARVRQRLDASIGGSALVALRTALAQGFPGWNEVEGGYRHDVQGGYVVYHPEDHELEIVATMSEELRTQAAARGTLSGRVEGTVEAEGIGNYYDDGWGGRTRERGLSDAQRAAEAALENAVQRRIEEDAKKAEEARATALEGEAKQVADVRWKEEAERRRSDLSRRAALELTEVGVRARQAFYALLGNAYRRALVSLARRRGVSNDAIVMRDSNDALELEFTLPD